MITESGKHRTKEGVVMAIAEMEDGHLMNLLNYRLRILGVAEGVIGNKENNFKRKLNGVEREMNKKEAYFFVENFQVTFAPYFLEASIRELELTKIKDDLRKYLGRKEVIKQDVDLMLLDSPW
jgi:hypothetical protein